MREVPAPEPLDAYGPWMLVENRRRRPASVSKQPSRLDTAQFVSQSRFNPIFAESNPTTHSPVIADTLGNEPVAPASHPRHDDMLQTSAANNIIAHPSVAYGPSTSKSTNNGRAPVVIRKTSQAVLKPRDTNISLKKTVGVNVRAGAAKKSSLNPAKHSVIVTSELADPIILHRLNPKQLPSPLIADSRADPPVQFSIISCHFQFIHCCVSSTSSRDCFFATFVYVSPHRRLRQDLWRHLILISQSISAPWVILGDFNATLTHADRRECTSSAPESGFQDMVSTCGLHELDFSGPHFTWYRGNCSVRLDRCIGNSLWFTQFPHSILHHLTRMKSDHRPICLETADHVSRGRVHSFHYFAGWTLHRGFHSFVSTNWNQSLPIAEAITGFKAAVTTWNAEMVTVHCHSLFVDAFLLSLQRTPPPSLQFLMYLKLKRHYLIWPL
ncbi:hypothetical protein V6N13_077198 [Hibiscus sabdariffa]